VTEYATPGQYRITAAVRRRVDGPTAVAFGRQGERFELYVTNGAFPFFPGPDPRHPSLMRLPVDTPGFPHL